jgi:hypothetical protein
VEMAFHCEPSPIVQFLRDIPSRRLRLKPERMPAQVNALFTVPRLGAMKTLAETRKRIAAIHGSGEFGSRLKRAASHKTNSRGASSL